MKHTWIPRGSDYALSRHALRFCACGLVAAVSIGSSAAQGEVPASPSGQTRAETSSVDARPADRSALAGKDSPAARLLREAFWLHASGAPASAVGAAYESAVDAEGPAAIRARALWQLAQHHREQAVTGAAIEALERLTLQFRAQQPLVKRARQAISEWQGQAASNPEKNWNSGLEQELRDMLVGTHASSWTNKNKKDARERIRELRRSILRLGDRAVPALRRAALARDPALHLEAVRALLAFDSLPPVGALVQTDPWLGDRRAWSLLFALSPAQRLALRADLSVRDDAVRHVGLLRWALAGDRSFPDDADVAEFFRRGPWPFGFQERYTEIASAIAEALPGERFAQLVTLSRDPNVIPEVRIGIEQTLVRSPSTTPTAAEWLDLAQNALTRDNSIAALRNAAARVGPEDATVLGEILAAAESFPEDALEEAFASIYDALARVPRPSDVPIGDDTIRVFFRQAEHTWPGYFVARASLGRPFVKRFVSVLFEDEALLREYGSAGDLLRVDESGSWTRGRILLRVILERFVDRWSAWDVAHREIAAEQLLTDGSLREATGPLFAKLVLEFARTVGDSRLNEQLREHDIEK